MMSSSKAPSGGKTGVFRHVGWEHLVAGVSGGVASTVILHPLDLIKIRFQGEHKRQPDPTGNVVMFPSFVYERQYVVIEQNN